MTEWQDDDEVTTTFGTLKQAQAEAAKAEQGRIVALLEAERDRIISDSYDDPENNFIDAQMVSGLISLIKGENK